MIPLIYQADLKPRLEARAYLLLCLLVTVLESLRDLRLERIAEALPMPILFESRRKKCNGSWSWASSP